ncbi:transcription termination factor NusA [Thiovibrio frasassiensis]|uniref:Transcription termination/antitermination protein NusA n=1 Tax=Thiovibrio frasassiensis TaxID=2984131 RepID=A0A9X4MEX5_9BACT|nr:transcription termination factor NusA [Thiovibrio frasassiensis]MDG4474885.1 transcription termination factor NusA [Thiovibrio frasassiensis]
MLSDLKRILDQISRDKGIDRQLLVDAIEEAVMSAAKKKFGQRRELEARYNDEIGEVELFQFRNVVPVVEDEQTEISLDEALRLDPEVQLGDELGSKMDSVSDLGRIAAQSAKQVIIQKMKDAECNVIYEMYKDRKGEVVNGIVQRFERGNIIVNLGRTDAILPTKEQMPRKSYRQGDRIRALVLDVRQSSRDPQLLLSRTNDEFLTKLFAMEVPEIAEGIVKIMGVSREPGARAKIAVSSSASDVDPVGACVGMKGSRVQNVVQELQGEKIDIVPWSPDPARYVSNALSPAQVSLVVVDEEKKTLVVVVPDDQLSLAIGRQGQNVRLAAALLGWRIDVKSEQKYAKFIEEGFQSLLDVQGMDEKTAEALYDAGFSSAQELGQAEAATVLAEVQSLDENRVARLIAAAQKVETTQEQDEPESAATEDGDK